MSSRNFVEWRVIESSLDTLIETQGGYTTARRGIISLPGDQRLFVKIGHDPNTKKWANKEISVYRFLNARGFAFAPKLLAVNDDETAFATEALLEDWDWSDQWTPERLSTTLQSMDDLARLPVDGMDRPIFEKSFISETADGWKPLAENASLQNRLREKLNQVGRQELAHELNFAQHAQKSTGFKLDRMALVHNDVRADNCAWNNQRQAVMLVDWNWAQLGDRRIDVCAFLTHVYKTGFDVHPYMHRLDSAALHWLAGFWFKAALQLSENTRSEQSELRDYQLASGIAAFDLFASLRSPATDRTMTSA